MKLYQEKLVEYKKEEENFRKNESPFKKVKQHLEDYVESSIMSRDYTIERIELRDGYELFYPALSIPEGFEKRSEQFFCVPLEGFVFGKPDESFVIHEYMLVDEKSMLEINVSEESYRKEVQYSKPHVWIRVNDKIIVMEDNIKYNIKIGENKFQFKRNFKNSITKVLITDILKDKNICYKDCTDVSSVESKELRGKHIENYLLNNKIQLREVIQEHVNRYSTCCDVEKIISDVEEFTKQDSEDKVIDNLYCLSEVGTLRVTVSRINHYIKYQDEQFVVLIIIPFKEFSVWITVIKKDYGEVLVEGISEKDIQEKDEFDFELNDLDMDKPMNLLDMLGL